MDFIRSHFGVKVVLQVPFCDEKNVQLVRVASFRGDFLQNQYFNSSLSILLKSLNKMSWFFEQSSDFWLCVAGSLLFFRKF